MQSTGASCTEWLFCGLAAVVLVAIDDRSAPLSADGHSVSFPVQELLSSNMAQNLQLVVQIAKEYTEQLGADKIIALLEGVNSYNGLYYYLGAYLAFSEDPEVRAFLHTASRVTDTIATHSAS